MQRFPKNNINILKQNVLKTLQQIRIKLKKQIQNLNIDVPIKELKSTKYIGFCKIEYKNWKKIEGQKDKEISEDFEIKSIEINLEKLQKNEEDSE